MHDLEDDPETDSAYECLSCGEIVTVRTRPSECPACDERSTFRNRAFSLE